MRIAGTVSESIVDGPGLRLTVFTQGCPHRCPGCHNPQTHDPAGGREFLTDTRGEVIIGIEPALKLAVSRHPGGCIGVLATEATLREEKFAALLQRCAENCHILKCPCPELVEFVERGELTGPALERCLAARLAPVLAAGPDALVLGCTHFPFAAGAIRRVVGPDVELLDGSAGTARETKRRLLDAGLLVQQGEGSVTIENSLDSPAILALSRQLLHAPIFPGRESFDK